MRSITSISLPPELAQQLERKSKDEGRSISSIIQAALVLYLVESKKASQVREYERQPV